MWPFLPILGALAYNHAISQSEENDRISRENEELSKRVRELENIREKYDAYDDEPTPLNPVAGEPSSENNKWDMHRYFVVFECNESINIDGAEPVGNRRYFSMELDYTVGFKPYWGRTALVGHLFYTEKQAQQFVDFCKNGQVEDFNKYERMYNADKNTLRVIKIGVNYNGSKEHIDLKKL